MSGHIILQKYSIDLHKKASSPPTQRLWLRGCAHSPLLHLSATFVYLPSKSRTENDVGEVAEDSSAPIRRQGELVSIKWYVLIPQITDTCSPLPSHPVASPLHHLMQCNHPHYLMKPYCTHPTPLPPQTHVYTVEPRSKLYNKYTKAWTSTTLSTERLLLPPHWKAPNATVRLL